MSTAENLIVHRSFTDVAGHELRAFASHDAVHHSGVAASLLAAPTRRGEGQFMSPVGDGEETRGGGKDVEEKVRGESEGVNVDVVVVNQLSQLVDLGHARELGLVNHQYFDATSQKIIDILFDARAGRDGLGGRPNSDATGHHAVVASIPEGPQRHVTTTFSKLPTELQREGGFSGGHGAVGKGEFSHLFFFGRSTLIPATRLV